MDNRTDAGIQIISSLSDKETEEIEEYLAQLGFDKSGNWQIVVKYHGNIQRIALEQGGFAQIIDDQYAVLSIPTDNIDNLLDYTEIEYIELPKNMYYEGAVELNDTTIGTVQNNPPYRLRGNGVLLGIVDSGINYLHPDFINPDGTTRIEYLWDQTISGSPPIGYIAGTEYTREQINDALRAGNRQQALQIVPSVDTTGHGTHVAGIAGGNGRGSNGRIVGAAPEADYIIVKLGQPDREGFVRNIEIMLGVKYVIEKARELGKPVAVNLSIGMNSGGHDGNSLIERYLDNASTIWKNNIVVGTGNEGNTRGHYRGEVSNNDWKDIELNIKENTKMVTLGVWFNAIDQMSFQIIGPNGMATPNILYAQGAMEFTVTGNTVRATYSGPSPLNGGIEFAVWIYGNNNRNITSGLWTIRVFGDNIVNGNFGAWINQTSTATFLSPSVETTLTIPSTASLTIGVGAYNAYTGQIAPFSGRGFSRNGNIIKPDITAPGVDIESASNNNNRYRTMSGTSMATPYVTGAVALMMQWGIVQRNNMYLYGENLKTYLLRGARRDDDIQYPSPIWGYGKLDLEASLDLLRQQLVL